MPHPTSSYPPHRAHLLARWWCAREAYRLRRSRPEDGMSTAEYCVGTLGAVSCAAVLYRIGVDGWFFDQLREIIGRALDPTTLIEHLRRGRPWTPLR